MKPVSLRDSLQLPFSFGRTSPALAAAPVQPDGVGADPASRTTGPVDTGIPVVWPLVAFSALGWASVAMSPWLIHWPLLLIALNPRMVFLLLVAPKLGLMEFTIVATIRLCLADPFSYLLGVRYGGRVRDRIDRSRLRRMLLKVSPVEKTAASVAIWLRPSQSILVWAGSLRLSPRYVALSDVATTALYVVLIHRGMSLF